MTYTTAQLVHNTTLAMLLTGSHVPPARLHTLKTAVHPTYSKKLLCQDPDCLLKQSGCLGNRFEVVVVDAGLEADDHTIIRYIAPHH